MALFRAVRCDAHSATFSAAISRMQETAARFDIPHYGLSPEVFAFIKQELRSGLYAPLVMPRVGALQTAAFFALVDVRQNSDDRASCFENTRVAGRNRTAAGDFRFQALSAARLEARAQAARTDG